LTGVFNRGHYERRLEQEVARARRVGRPLSLLLFDIDHFKECNDAHGHECGDLVLKDLAAFLKDRVRTEDLVARYGGEEFVVLLTGGATREETLQVAEKLRGYIASQSMGGRPAGEITVSAGVAVMPGENLDGSQLFRKADEALYRAKNEGRNRIVLAEEG
jgi:diguanylate cyclase (GGDEF)-like protein